MKQISIFIVGVAAAFATMPASAEDFTAGKTPAQLFRSDCGECHRSPNGLAKDRDVRALASFLREHYTTKSETAGALAAYVSGFASSAVARNRGTGAAPPPVRERSRIRSDADLMDAPANPGLVEGQPGRHRRTTSSSADGDRRGAREEGDLPRPPRRIGTTSPKSNAQRRETNGPRESNGQPRESNAQTRSRQPPEADDPVSRMRTYFSSGVNSERAIAEAGRTGAPKARKRRGSADDASAGTREPAAEPGAAPAAPAAVLPQADAPGETAPDQPQQ